jgi:hypothetical protein
VPTVILFQNGRDIVAKIDRDEEFQNHEMLLMIAKEGR